MTETIFDKHLFNTYLDLFSLVHVQSANMEEQGFWAILQPDTRGLQHLKPHPKGSCTFVKQKLPEEELLWT